MSSHSRCSFPESQSRKILRTPVALSLAPTMHLHLFPALTAIRHAYEAAGENSGRWPTLSQTSTLLGNASSRHHFSHALVPSKQSAGFLTSSTSMLAYTMFLAIIFFLK